MGQYGLCGFFDATDLNYADHFEASGWFNETRQTTGGSAMKPDYPVPPISPWKGDELREPSSRFLDEKISDDSGAEAQTDSALAPAGLNNPFWN